MSKTRTNHDRTGRARTTIAAAVAAAGLVLGAAGLAGADGPGSDDQGGGSDHGRVGTADDRSSTIVAVRGGYGNGFTVVRLDRTRQHLPTLSESMAECGEYHARGKRVRCWTETRTHYADLMEMRAAINYQKKLRREAQQGHGGHGH